MAAQGVWRASQPSQQGSSSKDRQASNGQQVQLHVLSSTTLTALGMAFCRIRTSRGWQVSRVVGVGQAMTAEQGPGVIYVMVLVLIRCNGVQEQHKQEAAEQGLRRASRAAAAKLAQRRG